MNRESTNLPELPQSFSMALAQNPAALERFASLSPANQRAFLARTQQAQSKDAMQQLVSELSELSDRGVWG